MKKIIVVLALAGVVYADYPKPTFTVNAHHFDRLHVAHEFDIVLLADTLLSEDDYESFLFEIDALGFYYTLTVVSDQFCRSSLRLYLRPVGMSCGSPVERPVLLKAGTIARIAVRATEYDSVGIFQLFLHMPDLDYRELLSELRVDAYYNYTGGFCGDGLHPYPLGDLTKDCKVNFDDVVVIAMNWMACTFECEI